MGRSHTKHGNVAGCKLGHFIASKLHLKIKIIYQKIHFDKISFRLRLKPQNQSFKMIPCDKVFLKIWQKNTFILFYHLILPISQ